MRLHLLLDRAADFDQMAKSAAADDRVARSNGIVLGHAAKDAERWEFTAKVLRVAHKEIVENIAPPTYGETSKVIEAWRQKYDGDGTLHQLLVMASES